MKCKDCGQEGFANVAEITKHKPECPGLKKETETKTAGEASTLNQQETTTAPHLKAEGATEDWSGADLSKYEPIEKGTSIGVTSAQYLKLKERYGEGALTTLHQRFDSLLEDMLTGKKEAILDVSHLPKDTLAGLHRGAELKFEVIGWLEKDRDVLHVTNLQYPRRGR